MNEKEKNIPEKMGENDTVLGDNENMEGEGQVLNGKKPLAELPETQDAPQKTRAPMSKRTKKRLTAVAIATGALLLVLAAVLITVSIIRNRPPKLEEVRGRFEELLTDSQEVNEIIWGAGLPTYKRMQRETKSFEIEFEVEIKKKVEDENGNLVEVKEKKLVQKTLGYYLFEDDTYGTVVSYEYQTRVMTGETTDVKLESGEIQTVKVYTFYDVEHGSVLSEYKNGASRFARKTQEPVAGETPIFEKNGYYYYALPNYQNIDLVYAGLYETEKEDERYDFVYLNSPYKSTDDIKAAIDAVYANAFMQPIYEYLFTGVIGADNDANQPAYLDYIDENDTPYLMKSNTSASGWQWREPLPAVEFDFSTMQMTEGNASKVTVTVDYRVGGANEVKQMEIDFVLENEVWLLNTPTFG